MPKKIYKYDIAIIGAGIVGLTIASKISKRKDKPKTIVLEKHPSFGRETSIRNSGVIHAGIYYKENSLKAKLCVEGNVLLYELCKNAGIPYLKTGKFIIAVNKTEGGILNDLFKRAKANGAQDVHYCSQDELANYKPQLNCLLAIHSPSTGIVDCSCLMQYLESTSKQQNVIFLYNSTVIDINMNTDKYEIIIQNPDNIINKIQCYNIINCVGLEADNIADMIGIDVKKYGYTQYYTKGEYFKIVKKNIIPSDKLIYRAREGYRVGTHTVISTTGDISLGPYSNLIERKIDYTIESSHIRDVFKDCVEFLPDLNEEDLLPLKAGVNPMLFGSERDYIISEERDKGFPGFFNLIGMGSPALTSCIAISNYVDNFI